MNFREQVLKAISLIPKGRVVSYGQVAAYCGSPRAARQVGWMLRTLDGDNRLPWWRVINSAGFISIEGNAIATPLLQKNFLESEGVEVSEQFKVDLKKYHYHFPT